MLARLIVLGLLARLPMSGYTIQAMMRLNQVQQWAGVLPGSVYHALKKLADEGFVVLQGTEHAGNRSKAIYAITPAGAEEFRRLLREVWTAPGLHFPVELYAALSFLDDMPREEVVSALDRRISALEDELATWNEGEVKKSEGMQGQLPGYLQALFANGRAHMEIDLHLLRHLRATLPSEPRLAWDPNAFPLPRTDDPGEEPS